MENAYYYQQMNKQQKEAYDQMLTCFTALEPSARVLRLDERDLSDVFLRLKLDHPEIFYVKDYRYRYTQNASYVELMPGYLFDKAKIKTQQQALQARVRKLLRPLEHATEEEKELWLHRFICETITYDKLKKEYSHEVIGPLINGIGVCEGIAKTVKLLCDEMRIACIVVICEADRDNGIKYRHAWNLIRIQGKWYHLDVTFDNTLSKKRVERFDYFNLGDERIYRDHRISIYPIPQATDASAFYYKKKGLSLTKAEDVQKRVCQALRKKQAQFVFHWRGGYLNRDLLAQLLQDAQSAAQEKGKCVSASVNYAQAVICLQFGQDLNMQITEEEADEAQHTVDSV